MKKLVSVTEIEGEGLESLLGEKVLLMCGNYFYTGLLEGVNADFAKLRDPSIVYETGPWADKTFNNVQRLHTDVWYVRIQHVESYGKAK
jgi:hypothetical protein